MALIAVGLSMSFQQLEAGFIVNKARIPGKTVMARPAIQRISQAQMGRINTIGIIRLMAAFTCRGGIACSLRVTAATLCLVMHA